VPGISAYAYVYIYGLGLHVVYGHVRCALVLVPRKVALPETQTQTQNINIAPSSLVFLLFLCAWPVVGSRYAAVAMYYLYAHGIWYIDNRALRCTCVMCLYAGMWIYAIICDMPSVLCISCKVISMLRVVWACICKCLCIIHSACFLLSDGFLGLYIHKLDHTYLTACISKRHCLHISWSPWHLCGTIA
jgi:hypothetical protein